LTDYRVNLDIFAGPLDLLLYLVRKEEVDIYDIPIAKITDQYIRYIELLKSLDIDLAGDFLVMAATLMQIKSAMLLPKAETDQFADDDLSDPRRELIRQLLEYKKFKDAANLLNIAADEQKERFGRPGTIIEQLKPDAEPEIDMEQVSIWDLLEAFDLICKATGNVRDISRIQDDTPIDLYQIEILHRLQTEGPLTFERIFESRTNRLVMIGLFLALLELIREKLVWAEQSASSSIYLRPLTEEPAEQAVQNAILTTEAGGEKPVTIEDQDPLRIPISELPAKDIVFAPVTARQYQASIPIIELSPKGKSAISQQGQEETQALPAEDHRSCKS
jgi:segregation and condensation protein A